MTRRSVLPLLIGLVGCPPSFQDEPGRIDAARLIAVVAEPPEARPGDEVTLSPVVAGRGGDPHALRYRFCQVPRPLGDPRPVAEACFDDAGLPLEPLGAGARGKVPGDACSRFGPEPTSQFLRPVEADATGGYYQPIVIEGIGDSAVLLLLRIHCRLPDVPSELLSELVERYPLNKNPAISGLEVTNDGDALRVTARWPAQARESYVWVAPAATSVEEQLETMRVSWFASGAELRESATGPNDRNDDSTSSTTLAPDVGARFVDVWAVLHDSRGGTAVKRVRQRLETR